MARLARIGTVSLGLSSLVFVSECGQLPGYRVDAETASFQQSSTTANDQIDLLFVIDNSASMSSKQTALANSFGTFMSKFVTLNLDFHIAVITTDMTNDADYWANSTTWQNFYGPSPYANFVNNGPATFLSYRDPTSGITNDRILTSSSQNLVQQFKQNIQLGSQGSNAEMGLLSTITALNSSNLSAWNANFIRPGALLEVIEISDEDESETDDTYVRDHTPDDTNRMASFKAALNALKPGHPELVRYDAVTSIYDGTPIRAAVPSDETYAYDHFFYYGDYCSTSYATATSVGYTLGLTAAQNNGTAISICSDFGTSIANLGASILTTLTQFQLTQAPSGDTISVTVNGATVSNDPNNGWSYDTTTEILSFHGTGIPPAGAIIDVTYIPSAPST